MLIEIAKRHGLELEEEAEYGNRKYLEKQDFILAKQKEQLAAQQSKLDELTLKVNDMETLISRLVPFQRTNLHSSLSVIDRSLLIPIPE